MSSIEWTDATWNPTTGCNKVSAGCKNCYAEVLSKRLQAMGQPKYAAGFEITLHRDSLQEPYKWKKPRKVFVNSMSDLFHPDVPFDFIHQVFEVMRATPQHTYQILTKRPERIQIFERWAYREKKVKEWADIWSDNIWMGTSVEDERVSKRIESLLCTDAKTKFLSCEPLLGHIDNLYLDMGIDWVIVGGESGHGARPMEMAWVRSIFQKCSENRTAFFFKQWGSDKSNPEKWDPTKKKGHPIGYYAKGGCLLWGQVWHQYPEPVHKRKRTTAPAPTPAAPKPAASKPAAPKPAASKPAAPKPTAEPYPKPMATPKHEPKTEPLSTIRGIILSLLCAHAKPNGLTYNKMVSVEGIDDTCNWLYGCLLALSPHLNYFIDVSQLLDDILKEHTIEDYESMRGMVGPIEPADNDRHTADIDQRKGIYSMVVEYLLHIPRQLEQAYRDVARLNDSKSQVICAEEIMGKYPKGFEHLLGFGDWLGVARWQPPPPAPPPPPEQMKMF